MENKTEMIVRTTNYRRLFVRDLMEKFGAKPSDTVLIVMDNDVTEYKLDIHCHLVVKSVTETTADQLPTRGYCKPNFGPGYDETEG